MIDANKLLDFLNGEITICDNEFKTIANKRKLSRKDIKNGKGIPDNTKLDDESNFWCGYRDAITEMVDFINTNKIENGTGHTKFD